MVLPFRADGGPVTGTAGKRQASDITPGTSKSGARMVKSRESRGLGRFSTVPEDKEREIPAGTKKEQCRFPHCSHSYTLIFFLLIRLF